PWGRPSRGRAGAWSKRTRPGNRVNMSHVDDGTLHAYLDGELSPPEAQAVEAHVAQCLACGTRLEEERALIVRAGELLAQAAAPDSAFAGQRQRVAERHLRVSKQAASPAVGDAIEEKSAADSIARGEAAPLTADRYLASKAPAPAPAHREMAQLNGYRGTLK